MPLCSNNGCAEHARHACECRTAVYCNQKCQEKHWFDQHAEEHAAAVKRPRAPETAAERLEDARVRVEETRQRMERAQADLIVTERIVQDKKARLQRAETDVQRAQRELEEAAVASGAMADDTITYWVLQADTEIIPTEGEISNETSRTLWNSGKGAALSFINMARKDLNRFGLEYTSHDWFGDLIARKTSAAYKMSIDELTLEVLKFFNENKKFTIRIEDNVDKYGEPDQTEFTYKISKMTVGEMRAAGFENLDELRAEAR